MTTDFQPTPKTMNSTFIDSALKAGKHTRQSATVIAFTGPPGSGKDSAAEALVNHRAFLSVAFADALRREIAEAWRIDQRMLTHRPTKEIAIPALAVGMCNEPAFVIWAFDSGESLHVARSPRWVMQQWATFRRRYEPAHYAAIVATWIARKADLGFTKFAVTDLRDPIEVSALRATGCRLEIVRLHRQEITQLAEDTAAHSSQRHDLKADSDLQNDGSLIALAEGVLGLADAALSRPVMYFDSRTTDGTGDSTDQIGGAL